MLFLKLSIVPLFIAAVTLAGRRWGTVVAGLLGGFPVVAGPIVIFMALEQGTRFGVLAATTAISAVAGLLAFGIAYSWSSVKWPWPAAMTTSLLCWVAVATGLAQLPALPQVAIAVAALSLLVTPKLLPRHEYSVAQGGKIEDLPYRMVTGGLLTFGVTSAAASLGGVWSGILAVFPVIGLVLAVFTHRAHGPHQVAHVYRGMVRGLYSFAAFFTVLALLWSRAGFWSVCGMAVVAGFAAQVLVQLRASPEFRKMVRLRLAA